MSMEADATAELWIVEHNTPARATSPMTRQALAGGGTRRRVGREERSHA